ncbi:unnamed protein product [Dovyalis caffra]|uniref:RING-type domain-containing protein n=1 Tax=Dovyalis caffra TaxID=77055 RepID=A0AAV1RLS4_9ROSI|nr:unnamed protein product [Dovyalis caffra]
MASEKPKLGDKLPNPSSAPQRNEELEALDPTNLHADHSGSFDDLLPPFPFFQTGDMQGMPQHYAQEMPLPAIRMMNEFSQFNFSDHTAFDHDYLHRSVPDIPLSEGNVNESVDYFPLCALTNVASKMYDDLQNSKIDRKVESVRSDMAIGSEMYREAAEANINDVHRSSLIGNQMRYRASTNMPTHYSTNGKGGINNTVRTRAAHSTHPQILDGSSLKLGVGTNTETRSTSNVSSRYNTLKYNEAARPQSSALRGQKDDISSLSSCSKVTGDFSTIRNNVGGFNNLVWDDGGFSSLTQNVDGLSRVERNAGGVSQQVKNVVEFSNLLQNVGGLSPQTKNVGGFSRQLQNVEQLPRPSQNEGDRSSSLLADRQHYHSVSSNRNSGLRVNGNARFSDVNLSTGFQGFPTEPLILRNRNQVGIPDYGHLANGLQSSSFIRNATQSASDQQQNPHTGSFTNLSPEPSQVAAFVGVTRSNSGQIQSGHKFDSVKLAQSQGTVPVQLFRSSSGSSSSTGQVISAVNAPGQASSVPCRPSLKRDAAESPLATSEALHRKVRVTRASSQLSTPNMDQIASPHAPPPLAWTPSLRPPFIQPTHPRVIQSPPNVAQINAPHPALVWIPHLRPPPVQLQTAHQNLAHSVSNLAQMTPSHSPLASTPTNPVLVQSAHPRLALFSPNLARAPPPYVPLARIPRSSPSLIQTVFPNLAQKPPICLPLTQNTSVRPPLSRNAPHVPPLPSTKGTDRIKWQDPEKTPKLSGHQCFICKRDLSFTPEGPVEQPVNPPPVAVLPCRHHFHAFCLERITTRSDAEDPPCIPCALGDKN